MVTRVARNPISIPQDVEVTFADAELTVKGKLGTLSQKIHHLVSLEHADNTIKFSPASRSTQANALTGTMSALAKNMVKGVSEGFECKLELRGVGYRAKASGKTLDLSLGFSHPVKVEMPEGVDVATPTQTEVVLKSADKQLVTQVAANIRRLRPPEPYKGKGIRYFGEQISLKEGKKK